MSTTLDVPEYRLNHTKEVAVGDYYFQPMDTCPKGVKVQLLNPGGVATYGQYDGKDKQWQGWAPVPRKRPE